MQFNGTENYLTSPELRDTVNVAIALERPLLIKGEPGTGKTLLAEAIAESLDMELLTWHVKSTTKAQDGLYVYDTVQRLNDARFNDRDISDVKAYIKLGPLGQAIKAEKRKVLLIDEIDKADMEFPNDLLHELDKMSFSILETSEIVTATNRPIVIITSNNEKELPDAFLRRCVFHYISFPDKALMEDIAYDADAQLISGSLLDYALPRADDTCLMEIVSAPTITNSNLIGAKGGGESGPTGALPATINAIVDALKPLGITHIDMPATPQRIWKTIKEAA